MLLAVQFVQTNLPSVLETGSEMGGRKENSGPGNTWWLLSAPQALTSGHLKSVSVVESHGPLC